jgi:hypothetical protein
MEVHESTLNQTAGLHFMVALAALHAHGDANFAKAGELVNKMYFDAISSIPYMTEGRSGEEMIGEERKKSIERFMEYRKATIKEPEPKQVK